MSTNINCSQSVANERRRPGRIGVLAMLVLLLAAADPIPSHAQSRPAPAAQAQAPVSVELLQFKVIKGPDGKERYAPADAVVPGDVIEYRATYRNNTDKPIADMAATLPIPEGTNYLPKSASAPGGRAAEAATAEGRYGREPLMRKVKGKDGKLRDEPVPYGEYRMLRWPFGGLNGKGEFTVKARVQVEGLESPRPDASPARKPQAAAQPKPPALRR